MLHKTTFIPTVTTQEGAILTPENWGALGTELFSLSLEHLLMKPGLSYLQTLIH